MVQQLFGQLESIKAEIRRLRGKLDAIAVGNQINPGSIPGTAQMPTAVDATMIRGNATPAWERFSVGDPGANLLNVVARATTDARPTSKALFDATNPATLAQGTAAAPGTSILAAHRDHGHALNLDDILLTLLATVAATELTIAGGVVTPTQTYHRIDTEADAATDNLDTITAPAASRRNLLFIRPENDARTVVLTTSGNILPPGGSALTLDDIEDFALLLYDAAAGGWVVIATNVPGAGATGYTTIEDEGVGLTQRSTMNFTGAGVSAADSGGKTVVTITGGSGTPETVHPFLLMGG